MAEATETKPAEPPKGRFARLVQKNPQLVASAMIGVAGLIATSIWQYRQQQTQRSQADAAQKVVEIQAANSWKIERTEILGKNLQTLALTGPDTVDQRYGVLLSLVRAEIIDPELSLSYALELGRDNAEYMISVLQSTPNKNYARLLRAFTMSCEERFGVSPTIDACADKLGPRSEALARLVAEDLAVATPEQPGPLALLKDERHVQLDLPRLHGFFETALLELYDRRSWDDLQKFAAYSPGAHLVMAIVLAAARDNSLATDDEAKTLEQFHDAQTKFLVDYLGGKACDLTCKGQMVEVMLTHYSESQGDYDAALRKLLEGAPAQSQQAIARMHDRILYCQIADADLALLRDRVLVPAALDLMKPSADAKARAALLGVLAVAPEPPASDAAATSGYATLVAQLDKDVPLAKSFRERRAAAAKQRLSPPRENRHASFCAAPSAPAAPAP